jgi:hypothetical protein
LAADAEHAVPVDIQQVLALVTRARELVKEPNALTLLDQIQAQIQQYAQDRDTEQNQLHDQLNQAQATASQLQASNATLQQQNATAATEIRQLKQLIDTGLPRSTPVDLARSFRDVVDTIQSEARAAPGVGVTVKAMDIEVKGLVQVENDQTIMVLPTVGSSVDPNSLSTLRVSFGAIPVLRTSAGPVVTAIEPSAGVPSGGTPVVMTGSGFTGVTGVNFGTTSAASFSTQSDTRLTATSPAGTGTVDVTVTTAAGTSPAGPQDRFTYGQPPVVNTIKPNQGPAHGGTEVEVVGDGLTGAMQVRFGDAAARDVSVESDTVLTAVTPAGTGAVPVTVTTLVGTSTPTPSTQFTYAAG